MNSKLFFTHLPQLLAGTITTIELMLATLTFGLILALLLTLISTSNRWYLKKPIDAFIFFIRGTPLLVQLFIIYYGLGQFAWLHSTPLWLFLKHPFACAMLAFSLNTAAYSTELFRGAIENIPRGEIEACQALGMSSALMLRRIILPKALRMALPAYSNEVIMILKCTTLASTVTLLDLTGMVRLINSAAYTTLEFFLIAGAIYLILNGLITFLFKHLEAKLSIPSS